MFRRANLFTAISGATSYDILRRDLQVALDDPSLTAIVLNFDTPGGEVTGVDELAKAIFAARSQKRIVAYVGGMAASAGYWLASQASEIVIAETAVLGSIGVRAVVYDTSKQDAEKGRYEFISSRAPGKRTDVTSDEGRARIQRTIDALEDVFIATVAKGRGVTIEDVVARFGGGDVLVGAAALAAGMADRFGIFEAVISELAGGYVPQPKSRRSGRMELTSEARAERERIKAILTSEPAKGRRAAAEQLAFGTMLTAEEAVALLATLPAEPTATEDLTFAQRSKDAPGGLVTVDPIGAAPPSAKAHAREMWAAAIRRLNDKSEVKHGAITSDAVLNLTN
jgi:ClpP class serine protease